MTPAEAVEVQKRLRHEVKLVPLARTPKVIAGCDVSMSMFGKDGFAGFVSLSFPKLAELGHSVAKGPIPFPYIPGLLSFREIPMLVAAWDALAPKPDLLVVDGVGIAHPRRLGIASHLGLVLDIPTIGCAKSVLTGRYDMPADEPGSAEPLIDPSTGETIGVALRTKKKVKPVFVSPGHRITLTESVDIMRACVRAHRLPEPTRLAHLAVNAYRIND